MKKIYYSLVIIFSIVLWGCQVEEDVVFNVQSRTLQIKAEMPGEGNSSVDEKTRVSLQPGDTGIKVRWEVGDIVYFVFAEEGVAKGKTEVTLKAENISDGGRSANFEFEIPETVGSKFDLYSVHGGNGFDGYDLKVSTIAESTAADLNGFGQNVTMYHSVVEGVNYDPNIVINQSFQHIGSLFHIKLNSLVGATLSNITQAILWSHDDIFAVQNESGDITYNPLSGNLNTTNYNNELIFDIDQTNLAADGTLDFWGWYIPGSTESWPALGLKLTTADGDIIAANAQPARSSATDKGKAYHFYAIYDGEQLLFTNAAGDDNLTTMMDHRDGTVYKTVKIDNQTWMAENLKYLPEVSEPSNTSQLYPYYYVYDYMGTDVSEAKATDYYQTYGVLYNWHAAMDACPDGWHLPSRDEWSNMSEYLIANGYNYNGKTEGNYIAKAMAEPDLWETYSSAGAIGDRDDEYQEYENKSGFSARPGGHLNFNNVFDEITNDGYWWSSTDHNTHFSYYWHLMHNSNNLSNGYSSNARGYSVRCVRDSSPSTTYSLTVNQMPTVGGSITGAGEYINGQEVSITATAALGYEFVSWSGDVNLLNDVESSTVTLTMPSQNITLNAHYKAIDVEGNFTDSRDGNTYKTIKIGNQTWMAENLKYLENGVSGPEDGSINEPTKPYYYVYGYDGTDVEAAKATDNYETYGVLYNKPAATTACPEGWHLPSSGEWDELENYLINNGYNYDYTTNDNKIALAMAEPGLWSSYNYLAGAIGNSANDPNIQNKSGFSARPGGSRWSASSGNFPKSFRGVSENGYWWSSTISKNLRNSSNDLMEGYDHPDSGLSVRCVKD